MNETNFNDKKNKPTKSIIMGIGFLVILGGCIKCMSTTSEESGEIVSNKGSFYYKKDYGDKWPFTIDSIFVVRAGYNEVYVKKDGRIYPLNGKAMQASAKSEVTTPLEEIRRENPDAKGYKIAIPVEFIKNALNESPAK